MSAFFNALSVWSFILSIAAAFFAARSATLAQELRRAMKDLPESRLHSLETSLEETQATLSELANRVKMQRVRNAVNHAARTTTTGTPDPYQDPDAWRRETNKQIALRHLRGNS